MVFFEAPHRTAETLTAMAEAFGADRRAAVCRELTKTYEEIRRGPLTELVAWAADGVRGEVTLVVAGAPAGAGRHGRGRRGGAGPDRRRHQAEGRPWPRSRGGPGVAKNLLYDQADKAPATG